MKSPFRLEKIEWRRVDLGLETPLETSAGRFEEREILIVRASVQVGSHTVHGFGEVSPLVGWVDETIDDCVALLERAPRDVEFDSLGALDKIFEGIAHTASLRFGVELCLLDALARHRNVPLSELLAAEHAAQSPQLAPIRSVPIRSVPVQHTIGAASEDETLARADRAQSEGYQCLKLKIGASSLTADVARITRVCKAFPALDVRLDVNGGWHPDDALHIIRALSKMRIDLIEQPVHPRDFSDFLDRLAGSALAARGGAQGGIDIAPDESCVPIECARRLIRDHRVDAVVLKPQALGGIVATSELMDEATSHGVRVILSTLLESAIGRSAIAHLAAAHPRVAGPHGLATGPWFANDVSEEPDVLEAGRLLLRQGPGIGFEPIWRSQ